MGFDMGGNALINGERSERIDFSASEGAYGAASRQQFKTDLVNLIHAIDNAVYAEYGAFMPFQTIGINRPEFDPMNVVSGSTRFLFDGNIDDSEFLRIKPSMGDVDLMISKTARLDPLWDIEDQPFVLVAMKEDSSQAITIWRYIRTGKNVQIDLERAHFTNGVPSDWDRFIRTSSWDDQKFGVRGVFHKWILRAATWKGARIVALMRDGKPEEIYTNMISFSVPLGMREKYIQNGDGTYRIPKREEMWFISDVDTIARAIFGIPNADITSFISVANIINTTFSDEEKARVAHAFAGIMFDQGAQCLYSKLLKMINIVSPLNIKEKSGVYYGEYWSPEMEEVFSRQD